MSDTTDHTNPAVLALREREADILSEIDGLNMALVMLEARKREITAAIDIVLGNGRKKPGRKPGAVRVVEKPFDKEWVAEKPAEMSLAEALHASIKMTELPDDAA